MTERAVAGSDLNKRSTLIAAMVVGSAALMVLGVQPLLLQALADEKRISNVALGQLATCELLALAVGAAVGSELFRRQGMRLIAAVLALGLAASDAGMFAATHPAALFGLRALAGALEGLLLGAAIVVITQAASPERANGAFLAVQTVPQAVAAFCLPVAIVPAAGANGAYLVLAVGALAAVAFAGLLPKSPPYVAAPAGRAPLWTPATLWAAAAVWLQSAGIAATWNYSAELASDLTYSAKVIGIASSGSLLFQVIGAAATAAWLWRLPAGASLIVGSLAQILLVLALVLVPSSHAYIAAMWVFGAVMLGLGPYQVALLIKLDPSRRAAMMISPLTLLGWAAGPLLASFAVSPRFVAGALYAAAGLFAASAVAYGLCLRPRRPGRAN
jgi:hypothetical protein